MTLRLGSLRSPSLQCIVRPVGGGAGGPGSEIGGGGQTIGTICQIPDDAVWVRFRFASWSPFEIPILNAAYTPTAQVGDGYNAYDSTGAPTTAGWRPITFANADAPWVEQCSRNPTEAHQAILPALRGATPADYAPQVVSSDWLRLAPLPRTDGDGRLINIRLFVPPGIPAFRLGHAAAPAPELGFHISGTYSFGNNAIAPFGSYGMAHPVSAIHGLDIICAHPTRTLIVVGDSIASGDYTTGSATSYGLAAAQTLSCAGHRTTAAILANPLQTTATFIANAHRYIRDDIANLTGAVIVIQCWSGNDAAGTGAATIEAAETSFAAALALAAFCQSRGFTPILATAAPVCANAPHAEPARRHANTLVRAAGLPVLDIDALTGTGATYKPGLAAWDNTHLGDAGQLAVAEKLMEIVMTLERS